MTFNTFIAIGGTGFFVCFAAACYFINWWRSNSGRPRAMAAPRRTRESNIRTRRLARYGFFSSLSALMPVKRELRRRTLDKSRAKSVRSDFVAESDEAVVEPYVSPEAMADHGDSLDVELLVDPNAEVDIIEETIFDVSTDQTGSDDGGPTFDHPTSTIDEERSELAQEFETISAEPVELEIVEIEQESSTEIQAEKADSIEIPESDPQDRMSDSINSPTLEDDILAKPPIRQEEKVNPNADVDKAQFMTWVYAKTLDDNRIGYRELNNFFLSCALTYHEKEGVYVHSSPNNNINFMTINRDRSTSFGSERFLSEGGTEIAFVLDRRHCVNERDAAHVLIRFLKRFQSRFNLLVVGEDGQPLAGIPRPIQGRAAGKQPFSHRAVAV